MNRQVLNILFFAAMISPFSVAAQTSADQNEDVKAAIDISIDSRQDMWMGQQLTINLDLKTTGFAFSNSHFDLPDVSGAFLMQTDTTTIKLTENRDGETWQIVRYPLALYPQTSGLLDIPPISVRFRTSAGFGTEEKAFELLTPPLQVDVKRPPGVKEGDLIITTTDFNLQYEWQPEVERARQGDALTLTVSRRAEDISAMLLPPLPVFRTGGLAAYPQAAEVNDKSDRGDLTGERVDSIIWVIEKSGSYAIPGIRFQWWDPLSKELRQQVIPGMNFDVPQAPAQGVPTASAEASSQSSGIKSLWLVFFLTGLFLGALWVHFKRRATGQSGDSEKSAFASLSRACASNHPGQTHSAIYAWLAFCCLDPSTNSKTITPKTITLGSFARACNNQRLSTELQRLQEALVSSDTSWQGRDLLSALRVVRPELVRNQKTNSDLPLTPLNP